jgi:hypothetical protein
MLESGGSRSGRWGLRAAWFQRRPEGAEAVAKCLPGRRCLTAGRDGSCVGAEKDGGAEKFRTLAQVRACLGRFVKLLQAANSEGKERRPIMNDLRVSWRPGNAPTGSAYSAFGSSYNEMTQTSSAIIVSLKPSMEHAKLCMSMRLATPAIRQNRACSSVGPCTRSHTDRSHPRGCCSPRTSATIIAPSAPMLICARWLSPIRSARRSQTPRSATPPPAVRPGRRVRV